jgi:hypothetical protein
VFDDLKHGPGVSPWEQKAEPLLAIDTLDCVGQQVDFVKGVVKGERWSHRGLDPKTQQR